MTLTPRRPQRQKCGVRAIDEKLFFENAGEQLSRKLAIRANATEFSPTIF